MNFNVEATPNFVRELKPLVKKYPSLKKEIEILANRLKEEPETGTSIGRQCYKIRLAIASKGRGKSGGGRIITHVIAEKETVFLISIYDKADKGDIEDAELQEILKSF